MMVANASPRIQEVERRPIVVVEGAPDPVVVVHRDGVGHTDVLHGSRHVAGVVLEAELRRMHAHDDEAFVLVLLRPRAHVRQRPQPVDAGISPEVDEDDFSLQLGGRQAWRIEPVGGAIEGRPLTWPTDLRIGEPGQPESCAGDGRRGSPEKTSSIMVDDLSHAMSRFAH